jgi:hypothetical protein
VSIPLTISRELGRPAAFGEVVGDAGDDNKNDRQCQKPGPPAVSCDEHIDLRCWVGPVTERPGSSSIYLRQREGKFPPAPGAYWNPLTTTSTPWDPSRPTDTATSPTSGEQVHPRGSTLALIASLARIGQTLGTSRSGAAFY